MIKVMTKVNMKMNNTVKEIATELLSYDNITIISHIRPDGDTLGCAFALKRTLKKCGKSVKVVCESEISPRYRFISDGKDRIDTECEGKIVCVDVASPDMAGKKYVNFAENADIVIDHHASNSGYGKLNLIDADAAACGEIMTELIEELCPIDKKTAEFLYTAISTDTGCFVYGNTTDNTHVVAAKLISCGINLQKLNKLLFRTKSKTAFEIERRALDSLEYYYDGTVISMKIELNWINELGACEDDMESISSIPGQIEGVKAAATFRQIGENEYKVSVRTNGEADGSAVCKEFGGGGHKMAAGCTVSGNYDELKKLFANRLHEGIRK